MQLPPKDPKFTIVPLSQRNPPVVSAAKLKSGILQEGLGFESVYEFPKI